MIAQPRNARRRRTAEALLSSARELLEAQGFEAMTRPRIMAVARAVEQVHRDDPDAGSQRARAMRSRHGACRRLMGWLAEEGRLADGWTVDAAADMLTALLSLDVIETLLVDRRWSRRRFVEHFRALLRATFVVDQTG
jgi:hypothetical protein